MAVQIEQHRGLRIEDLDAIGLPDKFWELVDGELIEMSPASYGHGMAGFRIARIFEDFCESRPELRFCADNVGFIIRRAPDTLLSPDAALFRARPAEATTWLEFAPEIAVEVLSPSNNKTEMILKRQRYFDAGTEQFWLVDPAAREIEFHFPDGRVVTAKGDATVPGEGIAGGMSIPLAAIFR